MPVSFGAKLQGAFAAKGQLCVGIDPHPELLEAWGLEDDIAGLESFSRNLLEICVDQVGIIKPQVAFFERFGARGLAVLEDLCSVAAESKLVVILDAKRGDIDSTMRAYFDAWLGTNAPFQCDALTVSPYLGFESLMPTLASCLDRGKGLFVLAATSNSGSSQIQKATNAGVSVARSIWDQLDINNAVTSGPKSTLGSFGAVIGATLSLQAFGLEDVFSGETGLATPILAPGFGAQGAKLSDSRSIFGAASDRVVHTVSRSVCDSGKLAVARNIESAKAELVLGLG